ncbi:hypothetical protein Acid7E03_41310 [Acidisoma sp. 7E03]
MLGQRKRQTAGSPPKPRPVDQARTASQEKVIPRISTATDKEQCDPDAKTSGRHSLFIDARRRLPTKEEHQHEGEPDRTCACRTGEQADHQEQAYRESHDWVITAASYTPAPGHDLRERHRKL